MENKYLIIGLLAAALIVAGYLFTSTGPVVSAQGYSSVDASPDVVSVYITMEGKDSSAAKAKEKLDAISARTLDNLETLGLNVELLSYNIYQEYEWINGVQREKGFVASQQVIVKLSEFDQVPEIVDSAISSGALVQSINFELSDEKQNEYKKQALEQAGQDAKEKAQATAAGLGKKIGRLVSVSSQDFYYAPYPYFAMESGTSARDAALRIQPSDIEVTASVTVEYKLS